MKRKTSKRERGKGNLLVSIEAMFEGFIKKTWRILVDMKKQGESQG